MLERRPPVRVVHLHEGRARGVHAGVAHEREHGQDPGLCVELANRKSQNVEDTACEQREVRVPAGRQCEIPWDGQRSIFGDRILKCREPDIRFVGPAPILDAITSKITISFKEKAELAAKNLSFKSVVPGDTALYRSTKLK